MKKLIVPIILFSFLASFTTNAQTTPITFGQNRVQYKKFKWQYYETEHFNVYFNKGGQDIGKYAILKVEDYYQEISNLFGFKLSKKVNLMVYTDISDRNQTNIGIYNENYKGTNHQTTDNTGFVYFNGNHNNLNQQIKTVIAQLFTNKMLAGQGIQQVVQGFIAMNLPSWYPNALVKYISTPYTAEHINQIKNGIVSGRFRDLSKVTPTEMELVMYSLMHYLEQKHGKKTIANLIYLIRVSRSLDGGFTLALGQSFNKTLEEWYYRYAKQFKKESQTLAQPNENEFLPIKIKKGHSVNQIKINPQGTKLAYITNVLGKYVVKVFDITEEKNQRIYKGGFKTITLATDLSNPLIAWNPNGKELAIVYERRDKNWFKTVNLETSEKQKFDLKIFQEVLSFTYAGNPKQLVFSAMQRGQTDLFLYQLSSKKTKQITNDFYDELQPAYVNVDGREGILFSSNRYNDSLAKEKLDTLLPSPTTDLFFYDLNHPENWRLTRITNTPNANEFAGQQFDSLYTFISDKTGINQQYIGGFTSVLDYHKTKYKYSTASNPQRIDSVILAQHLVLDSVIGKPITKIHSQTNIPVYKQVGSYAQFSNKLYGTTEQSTSKNKTATLFYYNQKPTIALSNNQFAENAYSLASDIDTTQAKKQALDTLTIQLTDSNKTSVKTPRIDTVEAIYQTPFDGLENQPEYKYRFQSNLPKSLIKETASNQKYKFNKTRQYFLRFMTDNINVSLDNSLLGTTYQPFNPGTPTFNMPTLPVFFQLGITDLMENHKIYGGLRWNFSFSSPDTEYFLAYENLTKRLDKKFLFYHRNRVEDVAFTYPELGNISTNGTLNTRTNFAEIQLKYALDVLNSLRFKIGFRNDRLIPKTTDLLTSRTDIRSINNVILKAEYVHDNTIPIQKNIMHGWRVNFFYEFHKEIPAERDTIFNDKEVKFPQFNNRYMMVWGFDARYYQKIYKTITWANRLAYSSTWGQQKMVYYLGSTDGVIAPQFNEVTQVNPNNGYAYQALATNLRGFKQNIRNGNSYMVLNSELRVPIFSALTKKTPKSPLLQNLQLIGFFDLGTAWEGVSPFGENSNTFEQEIINSGNPSTATAIARLKLNKSPFVMGYGAGLRLDAFGYFLRTDIGWGWDSGETNPARIHVAIGLDF